MRGDQLSRQWRVLRRLEVSRHGLTAAEVAEEGNVSLRTAYRDMDDLQLAGFPIYTEKEGKTTRWRFVPESFSFDDYVRHSFRVMQDELYAVTIRISPSWARYIGEKIWHQSQRIQKLIDGGIEISFRVAGLDEIRQWVLGIGPEAVVVKPDELKQLVRQSLEQTLAQYVSEFLEGFSMLGVEESVDWMSVRRG
ncbi:hypothetical protein Dvar_56190 [Desulfosarcina variabilis str. Montpellier]|uniref:transcriptional regulator n=1 Tax=Desulfosarcina variabilis TaxID=2300 RepID=UPI003AFAB00B